MEATDTTTVMGMNGKTIERGCHLFNTLGPSLLPHLLLSSDSLLARLMEMVRDGKFLPAMTLASNILGTLVKNQELRKRYVYRHSSIIIKLKVLFTSSLDYIKFVTMMLTMANIVHIM